MIHRIIQMAEEQGEPHFCARIIMHMPRMHISAIIMLLKILAIDGSLLSYCYLIKNFNQISCGSHSIFSATALKNVSRRASARRTAP